MSNFKKEEYLGQENVNYQGYKMVVSDYFGYDHIKVRFEDPYPCELDATYGNFLNGQIKNLYSPTVCGVGILGSKYGSKSKNGHASMEYNTWAHMLKRCYSEKYRYKSPTYSDVSVCEEWLYFENFYEWFISQSNYKTLLSLNDINLDKDILFKRNRIYAPDKCILVPKKVNDLFRRNPHKTGLPMGIHKYKDKYRASLQGTNNKRYLGAFDTLEEAFTVYKDAKEKKIQSIAQEEYDKGTITQQCYEAMMNYKVEITD